MSKTDTIFRCIPCGTEYKTKPHGVCRKCGAFQEFEEVASSSSNNAGGGQQAGVKTTGAVRPTRKASTIGELNDKPIERTRTGIEELDRVLGGGFVSGEVAMFSAAAGSGKSTLSMSISNKFANMGKKVLYVSGEESEQQIALRAKRMEVDSPSIKIVNETTVETILGHIEEEKPDLLIIDSLQTMASSTLTGSMGSIGQSKEAASVFTLLAKKEQIITILISQVTKGSGNELNFAGSNQIAHIVDCILYLESDSETPLKFLRAEKNRFGETTEVGVFQHEEKGLMEVSDPSGILLDADENTTPLSGTSVSFISEGVRQIPVEIQALVSTSNMPNPRKQFNGVDYGRGQIVCAILDKFCNAQLYDNDVFVNTVSGIKVKDPMADLAIAASILSSVKDRTALEPTAFIGELSLTGQVRGSFMIENKIREAERLGFKKIVIPETAKRNLHWKNSGGIKIDYISSVRDLMKFFAK